MSRPIENGRLSWAPFRPALDQAPLEPLELIDRMPALVPPPRFHGALPRRACIEVETPRAGGAEGDRARRASPMRYPHLWNKIAGLRDILIHHYFGIEVAIIWDIVATKIPEFERQIQVIHKSLEED